MYTVLVKYIETTEGVRADLDHDVVKCEIIKVDTLTGLNVMYERMVDVRVLEHPND